MQNRVWNHPRALSELPSSGALFIAIIASCLLLGPLVFSISNGYSSAGNFAVNLGARPLTVISPHAQSYGYFGTVTVSGDLLVVGAHGENVSGVQNAGRVYVFNATTGKLIHSIVNPNPQSGPGFGDPVALSGDLLVVGSPNCCNGIFEGVAYTFNALTGKLLTTLTSPNAQLFGYFGWAVAISGKIAIVGAYGETVDGSDFAGHAYAFNAETGTLIATFTSPNAQFDGSFGTSVAINGTTVLVGAPYETARGHYAAGHAYTFTDTGKLLETLTSPHAQEYGAYGYAVGMSARIALVSASGIGGEDKVYSLNARTGALINTLSSPNDHGFGWSVAISGSTAIIGAPFETVKEEAGAGRAYTFNVVTGKLINTLASPTPQEYGNYGLSVSVSGNTTTVGAPPMTADGYVEAGLAYLY